MGSCSGQFYTWRKQFRTGADWLCAGIAGARYTGITGPDVGAG